MSRLTLRRSCGKRTVTRAELLYTTDLGPWEKREWKAQPATLAAGKASAALPDKVTVFYFNLIEDRGLTVSTEHQERATR